MAKEALAQDLADFLVTKNFDPEYFDEQGQPAEAGDAKTIKFDYVSQSGKNYGTAVLVLADDELNFFYGDNLGRGMEQEDKDEWFQFLEQLSDQAASHSSVWSPKDINQLKHTLAGIAAIKEGLFEGYYGNRKVSYMGEPTTARLVINHNRTLGEDDKRYRYVESLYIETAEQERFRLPFKSLAGGRAMLEHVRQGGRPYDVRGNHIAEIVAEMAVLSRFNRAQHNRVFEGVTQELVESAQQYYHRLQETMKHLGSTRGYQAYFESWTPDQISDEESLVEDLRTMFIEQTLDARIEAALPTLAKIQQQETKMKEAQIFESWLNQLSEGTWALPETPEQMEKLNQLMSAELIVGPDATNATELLYDLIGDDQLFDILQDLADRSEGRANIWDDSDVQDRLAELGIQTPQSTEAEPADVEQDTAPDVKEGAESEADATLAKIANSGDDGYEMIYDGINGLLGGEVQIILQDMYDDVSREHRLHPDDDYEQIQDYMMDRIQNDYGQQGVAEGAKWRDPKYKDKLYTQEPGDSDDYDNIGYGYDFPERPKNDPGQKRRMGGVGSEFDRTDPLVKGQGIGRTGIKHNMNMAGKRKDLPSREQVRNLKGSIKDAHGKHVRPNLPEGDNQATFVEENADLARMLKHAGVPVSEGVLTDDTGNTWDHLLDRFKHEVDQFRQGGELDNDLYDALYDYYNQHGAMPYGVAKARSGDPYQWISHRLADDLGLDEGWKGALAGGMAGAALGSVAPGFGTLAGGLAGAYAGHKLGDEGFSDPDAAYKARQKQQQQQQQQQKPVAEGSCNMTTEGEYCPEHGLLECGMADGGAVGMPYSMGEDRPHPKELEMDALVRQMQIQQRADAAEKRLAQRAAEPKNVFQKVKKDIGEPIGKLARGDVKGAFLEGTDDPINSNSAMTGSYYESKSDDALLARIKSLALIK